MTTFASVWDALEDTPEQAENMKVRSTLMRSIVNRVRNEGWTQKQAAELFGVTQPRISDLMRGKIDLFGIDALINMATTSGMHVDLVVREKEAA